MKKYYAFLLAFSQTFGDIPLAEALSNHAENDEEHPVDAFSRLLLNAYYDHSAEVDDEIRAHLRNWTMERLPRVSLTVLRLAVAEMLFGGENKPGVAINEAVELAKQYGGGLEEYLLRYLAQLTPEEQAEDVTYARRLACCGKCTWYGEHMCRACGCYVQLRAAVKGQNCPYEKWEQEGETHDTRSGNIL